MIQLQVPAELADLMVSDGMAIKPTTRGPAWELVVTGLSSASVIISLLQGPDTFSRLAQMVKEKFGSGNGVSIELKANGRRHTIVVRDDSDLEQLTQKIQDILEG